MFGLREPWLWDPSLWKIDKIAIYPVNIALLWTVCDLYFFFLPIGLRFACLSKTTFPDFHEHLHAGSLRGNVYYPSKTKFGKRSRVLHLCVICLLMRLLSLILQCVTGMVVTLRLIVETGRQIGQIEIFRYGEFSTPCTSFKTWLLQVKIHDLLVGNENLL